MGRPRAGSTFTSPLASTKSTAGNQNRPSCLRAERLAGTVHGPPSLTGAVDRRSDPNVGPNPKARPKGFEPLTSGLENGSVGSAPSSNESQASGSVQVGTKGRVHRSQRFAPERAQFAASLLHAFIRG